MIQIFIIFLIKKDFPQKLFYLKQAIRAIVILNHYLKSTPMMSLIYLNLQNTDSWKFYDRAII